MPSTTLRIAYAKREFSPDSCFERSSGVRITAMRCHCCLIPLNTENSPQCCQACWDKLSPAERMAHMDRLKMNATVQQIADDVGAFLDKAREALKEGMLMNRFGGRN